MSIQPKININLEEINTKKQRLENIKIELKREFIGIDYIIEELVDYIQIWYLMPEILTRPIIVNLWGMTGVGKTDLIRKLVSKLDLIIFAWVVPCSFISKGLMCRCSIKLSCPRLYALNKASLIPQ